MSVDAPVSDLPLPPPSLPINHSSPPPTINGTDTTLNGGVDHSSPVSLPPNTPDVQTPDNVKINLDDAQQEPDARTVSEPVVVKEDLALPPAPPLVEDVKMEEQVTTEEPQIEEPKTEDHPMGETNGQVNGVEVPTFDPPTAYSPPEVNGDHSSEPPAKRARKHSDADQASNHMATPPPPSASSSMAVDAPTPTQTSHSSDAITPQQYRHCQSIVRSLKKSKDAGPFLRPVDAVALAIPHYYKVITRPMDFGTVERKLTSSNPGKPDTNSSNPRYHTVDDFVSDVRLIFSNCIAFNGEDHLVSAMARRLEEQFDKQLKTLPGPDVGSPSSVPVNTHQLNQPPKPKVASVPKKTASPPAPPPPKKTQPRRPSTSTPVQRKSDPDYGSGRPKREVHPQPSKESFVEPAKKSRKPRAIRNDGTEEQFKFCAKVLQELHKKQYYNIAYHFYEPVDWQRMGLPDYPKYVKKPMDLSTMKRKLENGEYPSPGRFHDDFKLMIRNCFNFNPAGTPVNQAGIELQRIFDEKWTQLPPLHDEEEDDGDDDDQDSEEEEKLRQIADMEREIEMMRNNIVALKGGFPKQAKEKRRKEKPQKPPTPSTSKPPPKPAAPKPAPPKKKAASTKKVVIADDDVLTFEQKKDLSEAITRLDGPKLERVIQIIHEGVPDLKNSNDEIELEVDLLPAAVLTKLFNFVIRPLKQAQAPKRNRGVKGTGTGGLKRKSMDEDVEAEKIRQLEERMALFDNPSGGGDAPVTAPAPAPRSGALSDSDSSSDDSSGSESD